MELVERLARRMGSGANVALGMLVVIALAYDVREVTRIKASGQLPLDLGVGIVISATALLRARNRAWTAAIGLVVFASATLAAALWSVSPVGLRYPPLVGLVVLAASAVRWLPPRQAMIIAGVGTSVVAVAESSHAGGTFNPRALFALFGATVWGCAVAVGVWLRYLDRRREVALEGIRREERLQLARELHDVVAHHVTGIVVQAQAARFVGDEHSEPLVAALASIESAGVDTLAAIRKLVGLLRDPEDAVTGLSAPESLDQLVERFSKLGPSVELRVPADMSATGWPLDVASTVYRVVQESLTNIARHAPNARSVTVTIAEDSHHVTVEVTDDAPAITTAPSRSGTGYGLVGMCERVEVLGGKVRAGPLPLAGWTVRASLPLPATN